MANLLWSFAYASRGTIIAINMTSQQGMQSQGATSSDRLKKWGKYENSSGVVVQHRLDLLKLLFVGGFNL